jgi:hypothetical protein
MKLKSVKIISCVIPNSPVNKTFLKILENIKKTRKGKKGSH